MMRRRYPDRSSYSQPICEDDIIKLRELVADDSQSLIDYIRELCLFRMSMFGYNKENPDTDKLDKIIQELGEEVAGKIQLPQRFEIARKILLRLRKESDFDRVLEEVGDAT